MGIRTRRVYDLVRGAAEPAEARVELVDRLWPRGVAKAAFAHDGWAKDAAPSGELRREFHAGGMTFDEFAERYRDELGSGPAAAEVERLTDLAARGELVLAYAARDETHNHAEVLAAVLRERLRAADQPGAQPGT